MHSLEHLLLGLRGAAQREIDGDESIAAGA